MKEIPYYFLLLVGIGLGLLLMPLAMLLSVISEKLKWVWPL